MGVNEGVVNGSHAVVAEIALTPNLMKTRSIHPPESAKFDEVEFARWVQAIGHKLLYAGITDIELVPVVVETGELYLTVFCDEETGRKIKAAIYS